MSLVGGITGEFKTGDYTVTRTVAGSYASGRYTPGAPTTFEIEASVRPASGRDLQQAEGVEHTTDLRRVYTTTELRTRTPTTEPDTIAIDGENWTVINVAHFGVFDGGHYRALVSRQVTTV